MQQQDQVIEFLSALTCVVSIWFNVRRRVEGWPIGLISIVLAAWVYFRASLFAECALQSFFFISGFYGWWQWTQNKNASGSIIVQKISSPAVWAGVGIAILGWIVLYFLLKKTGTASQPLADSGITAFSILAQFWLARKYLENWILWIAINLASIALYISKDLWFFTGLYTILLVLAVKGFQDWRTNRI
jgi:nicotinamide mononucleotide transporter